MQRVIPQHAGTRCFLDAAGGAALVEGAEQAAPGDEDPEALYEGAPILEGGDEEEWEQWVD